MSFRRFTEAIKSSLKMDAAVRLGDEEKSLLGQTKGFLASLRNDRHCHFFLREGLGFQIGFEMTTQIFRIT